MTQDQELYHLAFDAITAVATVGLALAAWRQLGDLKAQQRGWESLKACDRYDSDPELNKALRTLRKARNSGQLEQDPLAISFEIVIVLNYLEGLASGIEQGFYNEAVVKAHMQPVVDFHAKELLNKEITAKLKFESQDYDRLRALWKKCTEAPTPWYMRTTRT